MKVTRDYCPYYYCEIKDSMGKRGIKDDIQGSAWSTKWRVEYLLRPEEGWAWDKVLSLFLHTLGLREW